MPDWLAPFHMPEFTDKEYDEQKLKYVAKKGYTITVPALSDIFHFGKTKPMTERERVMWRNEQWQEFTYERIEELKIDMEHKKDRMIAMLGSPTPELFRKLGAILTAVDDAQDAISTVAAVARIGRKIAPKLLGRLLTGPIGILLTVNDILNVVTGIGSMATFGSQHKRMKELLTGSNPWSGKAKLRRWRKTRSWKPTFADVIQAAQTTDQVFGVGVSLGPVTGFIQDAYHGFVRQSAGQKVTWKMSPHSVPEWIKTSYRVIKSTPAYLGIEWGSDDMEILTVLQAQAMAQESIMPFQAKQNPLDMVNNIEGSEIHSPFPTHPTTLWAMKEIGIDFHEVLGWPIIDKVWASPDEITEAYAPAVTKTINKFVERHNHDSMGVLAASIVADSAMYQMANLVGEEDVEYDYTAASKAASALMAANLMPAPHGEQDPEAVAKFIALLEDAEQKGESLNVHLLKYWAKEFGYKLVKMS